MPLLSLLWFALGALLGGLTLLAGWAPRWAVVARWQRWLATLGLGAFTALVGGWLASVVLDRLVVTLAALWLTVMVLGAARWWTTRAQR
ncbi:MAG TPA: hypothetical protein VF725_08055 [Ktedonobacterales bacterium]